MDETLLPHDYYMRLAIKEAEKAFEAGEVPVGAVVVSGGKVIGKGYNQTVQLNDPTAHAEMIAMTSAFQALNSRYLSDCTLYVTLEPCLMCAGAIFWACPSLVVFGSTDEKRGYQTKAPDALHKKTRVIYGVLEKECKTLLTDFFQKLRK